MDWDLSALYKEKEELDIDVKKCKKEAKAFEKKYSNNLSKLKSEELLKAIKKYENILENISLIMSYVFLEFATDSTKGGFFSKYQKLCNDIQEKILFFEIEINKIDGKKIKTHIKNIKKYSYYLQKIVQSKPHQLELSQERVLLKKEPVGSSAFSRLFDEHFSRMKFKYGNRSLSEEEILSMLYDEKRDIRKRAQESMTKGLEPNLELLAYIFNMIRSDTKIECDLRKYSSPEESRHIDNQISQKSVDALVDCVNSRTEIVSKFYTKKAKILNLSTLYDYDRYAPISKKEGRYSFEESKDIVLDSLGCFSPKFKEIAQKAFDERWIDAFPKENKRGGAFSHGTVPKAHPYVLLNHTNRRRDMFTLAHELGHAIHQYLSRDVGYLNSDTPLTTSETASIFSEMLLFDHISKDLENEELLSLYGGKLEDIFATLFRQIVFTNFERRVHAHKDELKPHEYSEIWREENSKMFGKSVRLTKNYDIWWSYIPHFIHSPFYCYSYSYGQLLVLALFGLYKQGFDGFEKRYINFLSSGGSKSPKELVELFGFDIESEEFWLIGMREVESMVEKFMELKND